MAKWQEEEELLLSPSSIHLRGQSRAIGPRQENNKHNKFHAIQTLQNETACTTIDEMIEVVEKSYSELSAIKLNNVFLSLQGCLLEIMKVGGRNKYKTPHYRKEAMIRAGTLPLNLKVDPDMVRQSLMHLLEAGKKDEVEILSNALGIEMPAGDEE